MNTIPETFGKNGYAYALVKRTPSAAIYSQTHNSGRILAYELHRVRTRDERKFGETTIKAGEYLPSTEEWGRFGWTYSGNSAFEAAEARMMAIGAETPKTA